MRTPIRSQSRLLTRRSYKPGRGNYRLNIIFQPTTRTTVKIVERKVRDARPPFADGVIEQSE